VIKHGTQNGVDIPYFLIGALLQCSFVIYYFHLVVPWDGCWFTVDIRCRNNTAMEPYRAFIADKLDIQTPLGFQMQSFFTGFRQTLAVGIFIFFNDFYWKNRLLPTWVYASFFLGPSVL
jgi:maltose/moltooligosaccharide transporter